MRTDAAKLEPTNKEELSRVTHENSASLFLSAVGEVMHPTPLINEVVKGDEHEAFSNAVPHCLHRVKRNSLSGGDAMVASLARESGRLKHVSARCKVNKTRWVLRKLS